MWCWKCIPLLRELSCSMFWDQLRQSWPCPVTERRGLLGTVLAQSEEYLVMWGVDPLIPLANAGKRTFTWKAVALILIKCTFSLMIVPLTLIKLKISVFHLSVDHRCILVQHPNLSLWYRQMYLTLVGLHNNCVSMPIFFIQKVKLTHLFLFSLTKMNLRDCLSVFNLIT